MARDHNVQSWHGNFVVQRIYFSFVTDFIIRQLAIHKALECRLIMRGCHAAFLVVVVLLLLEIHAVNVMLLFQMSDNPSS